MCLWYEKVYVHKCEFCKEEVTRSSDRLLSVCYNCKKERLRKNAYKRFLTKKHESSKSKF